MIERRAIVGWVFGFCAAVAFSGCARHEVVPAFRAEVRVHDRGIFVPLPPPSFRLEPIQSVQLGGTLEGQFERATEIRIVDELGGADVTVPVAPETRTFSATLTIDLREHCLAVWGETFALDATDTVWLHAEIVSDTELLTVPGCPDET